MTSRLAFFAAILFVLSTNAVEAQLALSQSSSVLNHFVDIAKPIKLSIGKPSVNLMHSTRPTMNLNALSTPGGQFWTGSVSAQSFQNGKFGRFYYWDGQGNLRSSSLFFDISGKGKRGPKLVLSKHRMMVDRTFRITN